MTTSETPVPAPAPPPAPVLAAGHLHPAVLLLRLFDAVRQALFLVVLGLLLEPRFLLLALFVLLLQLGYGLVRYLTFHYVLNADELVTREGILSRQERRIPTNRIQDLGLESTLLRRLLGLVVVVVETASGKGAEARLDSLSRPAAEHLREVLLAARQAASAPAAAAAEAAPLPPEWLVHRTDGGLLLVRGFTDLRLSAIVLALLAAWELANQFGLGGSIESLLDAAFAWLRALPLAAVLALAVLLVLALLGSGLLAAALASFVMFHGFVLTLRGGVLQRRYGLLTTRQKSLPLQRLQRVLVEQNWLRRLFGFAVLRADSAGSGMDDAAEQKGGWDVVGPLLKLEQVPPLLPLLLPGLEPGALALRPVSPRVVLRIGIKGALLVLLALALLLPLHGWLALLALLGLPLAALVGWLCWHNLGYAVGRDHLQLRWGVLGRYQGLLPLAKVQAVRLRAGPIQRLLGLASLVVHVAGGSPTRLPDLPRGEAAAIGAGLAAAAAAAAARDWRRRPA